MDADVVMAKAHYVSGRSSIICPRGGGGGHKVFWCSLRLYNSTILWQPKILKKGVTCTLFFICTSFPPNKILVGYTRHRMLMKTLNLFLILFKLISESDNCNINDDNNNNIMISILLITIIIIIIIYIPHLSNPAIWLVEIAFINFNCSCKNRPIFPITMVIGKIGQSPWLPHRFTC